MPSAFLLDGLEQLKDVGLLEISFEVSGLKIVLRSLKAEDDILIARKMAELDSEGLEYVQTYKMWMVAYSIAQLNDMDLRGIKAIPLKPEKEGDKPKTKTKEEYLFELLSTWSRSVVSVCFKKYGELLVKTENSAEEGVEYEVFDVDAEIKRLQDKIESLKSQKETPSSEASDIESNLFENEKLEAEAKLSKEEPSTDTSPPEVDNDSNAESPSNP